MLQSTWKGTTTVFSFSRDCGLRCLTWPNPCNPGRRAGPFLTLPTIVFHSFHLSWRWEEVGVFVGQKRWVHCIFPFSTMNLPEILPFHAIFCKSAANMQQSTLKEVRNQEKGQRAMGLSPTKPTINLSNWGGVRGCDASTIEPDNIATNVT